METPRHGAPLPCRAPAFQAPAPLPGGALATLPADPHSVLLANLLGNVLLNHQASPLGYGCGVRDLAGALRSLAASLEAVANPYATSVQAEDERQVRGLGPDLAGIARILACNPTPRAD